MALLKELDDVYLHIRNIDTADAIKQFLKSADFNSLSSGEKIRLSNELTVVFLSGEGTIENLNMLEAHRTHADLHYTVAGTDLIAIKSITECKRIFKNYSEAEDYILFNETPSSISAVEANTFF